MCCFPAQILFQYNSNQYNKIIGVFFGNRQHTVNCLVRFSFFISFGVSDRYDGELPDWPDSWNGQKAEMTEKPERPGSRNYQKSRNDMIIDPSANILAEGLFISWIGDAHLN